MSGEKSTRVDALFESEFQLRLSGRSIRDEQKRDHPPQPSACRRRLRRDCEGDPMSDLPALLRLAAEAREAAERATPGPWTSDIDCFSDEEQAVACMSDGFSPEFDARIAELRQVGKPEGK